MKKEIRHILYHLLVLNLKDPTIKSIYGQVITVAGYVMNICKRIGHKTVKSLL